MNMVCQVCMHHCTLSPGQTGLCRARKNENGQIVCINYGRITSIALDPIEKKPLQMFYPGSLILSVGSFGCNLRCPFCQNHEISMTDSEGAYTMEMTPQMLVDKASAYKDAGNIGVAYTYNEPLIGWEYVRDTAVLVKAAGMKNVLVTNGTVELSILEELLPYMDAMNIDLKGFRQKYYEKLGGSLETVKEFITHAAADCHVELTTLIVQGENDEVSEMEEEAAWIASVEDSAGKKIPLHVTRFFPRFHMLDKDATDVAQIHLLADTARKYLDFVFVGNC
ncbi:MAG: AmmeMemoRadiSam system radical SAM enzyme [Lachnospiraceae bacterium]|nr:AmmeMemoRadiSam system radical SAM enzyme [Lachnospiraceae bacterium]